MSLVFFPFQRFTADELRHFFVWCAAHKVSDVDLTGGSPVSRQSLWPTGALFQCNVTNHTYVLLIDELFGREVIPRVLAGNPVDRTIQINGDASGRYGLKRGERIRLRSHLIQGTSGAEEKAISITMRVIPTEIPDILSMNIEPDLLEAMVCKSGLGFVCGETGSGKINAVFSTVPLHYGQFPPTPKIVTYEDPVEYILEMKTICSHRIRQKSGVMWSVFAAGLRSAVRRNPEIIGVGEIRDNETADAAVQAGNTGHYCLSTMHTKSPGETLARLLGCFPSSGIRWPWAVLSLLQFILVQVLVRTNDGGRKSRPGIYRH
ncbi:plasmid transfer ATPase TraJ [Escherichia coli]|nr:plasmid transfer ATPase TraJ [Escherichia coli]